MKFKTKTRSGSIAFSLRAVALMLAIRLSPEPDRSFTSAFLYLGFMVGFILVMSMIDLWFDPIEVEGETHLDTTPNNYPAIYICPCGTRAAVYSKTEYLEFASKHNDHVSHEKGTA